MIPFGSCSVSLASDVESFFAEMKVLSLGEDRFLHYYRTERFKTGILSVRFVFPVTVGRATADSLFPALLAKGCVAYPSERALSRRLDELYGTDFAYGIDRSGDRLAMTFTVDYLSEKFVPDGLDLPREVISLLRSIICEPLADPEIGFSPELTRLEVAAQLDRFHSIKNHKARYASHRTRELLRDKRRYDVPLFGTLDELAEITPLMLYEQYLHMLSTAEVHFYYVGREAPERLAEMLRELQLGSRCCSALPSVPRRGRAKVVR
jgi:predicted Zn-dependent peptidase